MCIRDSLQAVYGLVKSHDDLNIIKLCDDAMLKWLVSYTHLVIAPLVFLREREIVHFQRFGEALAYVQKQLDSDNYYRYNPAFDK